MSESIIPESSKSKLRRLMELREARDTAKEKLAVAEEEYRDMEAEVFESLEGIVGALKVPLGPPWGEVSFTKRETTYAKLLNEDEFMAYLKKHAKDEEMTTIKFSGARMNEMARTADESGTDMPPGLSAYKNRGVSIKAQKKR